MTDEERARKIAEHAGIDMLDEHDLFIAEMAEAFITIRAEATLAATRAEREANVNWVVSRWKAEVENRPMQNVHRRSLDDTWRQVIRHFGCDDRVLCGPPHDEIAAAIRRAE